MADHRAQVEELLADYRRSREQLGSVQRALAEVRASATSADGTVTATVDAQGRLAGLVLADTAYVRHRPPELAELIVRTAGHAVARAARAASDVIAPLLPAGTDPAALLAGTDNLTADDLRPANPVAEDSFENHTWLLGPRRRR